METTKDFLEIFISIFTVINLILYVYSWIHHKSSRLIQILMLYTFSLFVTHFTMYYLQSKGINNLYIGHFHFGLQFLILGLFYRTLFKPSQKKWVTIILISVFAIMIGYYIIKPDKYVTFNLIDIIITTVPLIFFSITHLYNTLTETKRFFIINAGVLVYLSTSSFIFFLGTYLHKEGDLVGISDKTADYIWDLSKAIYLIYLLIITIEWRVTIYKWKIKNN
ncbi:MAG: hypothetical protein ACJA1H_002907 [Glaciecola sp.]|jgi:hypothetical protein